MDDPASLESDVDSGAEVVPCDSDCHKSGDRRAVSDPCVDVGTIGSGALCRVGDQRPGGGSMVVDGARVLGRPCCLEVIVSGVVASVAHPVSTLVQDASSDSNAASGRLVCLLSSFPLFFLECDGGNVCRIVLCDGCLARDASSPNSVVEIRDVGCCRSSTWVWFGASPCSIRFTFGRCW